MKHSKPPAARAEYQSPVCNIPVFKCDSKIIIQSIITSISQFVGSFCAGQKESVSRSPSPERSRRTSSLVRPSLLRARRQPKGSGAGADGRDRSLEQSARRFAELLWRSEKARHQAEDRAVRAEEDRAMLEPMALVRALERTRADTGALITQIAICCTQRVRVCTIVAERFLDEQVKWVKCSNGAGAQCLLRMYTQETMLKIISRLCLASQHTIPNSKTLALSY